MDREMSERANHAKIKREKPRMVIDEFYDPNVGFDVILDKELEVDFILNGERERNQIIFKLLIGKDHEFVKIQLLSETDLFFYYENIVSHSDLKQINATNSTTLTDLSSLVVMMSKYFAEVETNEKELAFEVKEEQKIEMTISKLMNHKYFTVLSMSFTKLTQVESIELAAYRFGSIRQEVADLELKINGMKEIVRSRNPYLLTFINKL